MSLSGSSSSSNNATQLGVDIESSAFSSAQRLAAGDSTMIAIVVSVGVAIVLLLGLVIRWRYKKNQKLREIMMKTQIRENINFNQEPRKMTVHVATQDEMMKSPLASPSSSQAKPSQVSSRLPASPTITRPPIASVSRSPPPTPKIVAASSSSYTPSSPINDAPATSSLSESRILTPVAPASPRSFRAPPPLKHIPSIASSSPSPPPVSPGIFRIHMFNGDIHSRPSNASDMGGRPSNASDILPGSADRDRAATTFLETELCDVLEDELDGIEEDAAAAV